MENRAHVHVIINTISCLFIVYVYVYFYSFFSGFCKALKRDDDKVVMVYSVEIYDAMYSAQWFNGMEIYAYKYAVQKIDCTAMGRRILCAITDALNATHAGLGNTRR